MADKKIYATKTFDESLVFFRNNGFEVLDAPGSNTGRMLLRKYGCAAGIERDDFGHPRIFAYPSVLIAGEPSKLVDKGYQKILRTSRLERAATADDLRLLHKFSEEVKEAMGTVSLYNESLGTVSEDYHYDRVNGREGSDRRERPWDKLDRLAHRQV